MCELHIYALCTHLHRTIFNLHGLIRKNREVFLGSGEGVDRWSEPLFVVPFHVNIKFIAMFHGDILLFFSCWWWYCRCLQSSQCKHEIIWKNTSYSSVSNFSINNALNMIFSMVISIDMSCFGRITAAFFQFRYALISKNVLMYLRKYCLKKKSTFTVWCSSYLKKKKCQFWNLYVFLRKWWLF